MTETAKESISVLVDEEISEIELHRLLRQFGEDGSLRQSLISFQQIRAVIRGEHHLPASRHLELHDRISAAIAADTTGFGASTPISTSRNWYKPAAGFAVAASLVVAVAIGMNQQPAVQAPLAEVEPQQVTPQPFDDPEDELQALSPEKQKQLREYLYQHERNVRMNPNSRTVTYKKPSKKD